MNINDLLIPIPIQLPTGLILQHSTLLETMGQAYCSYCIRETLTTCEKNDLILTRQCYCYKSLDGIYRIKRETGDGDVMDSS